MAQICNSMWSFHRMLGAGRLDAYGFPKACADLGITLLEVNQVYLPAEEAEAPRLREAISDAGCTVVQMTCDFGLCSMDEAERKSKVEQAHFWARYAQRLGAAVIRYDLGRKFDDVESGTRRVIESFREIVPVCAELGLTAVIENHGGLSGTAENILHIIEAVGSKAVGTCPDFGNFPDDVRYDSLAKIAPHAAHVHAKTLTLDASGNETAYDYPRCVQIMKDAGYRGAWGIEFEGELGGAVPDEKSGVRMTRELLARLV